MPVKHIHSAFCLYIVTREKMEDTRNSVRCLKCGGKIPRTDERLLHLRLFKAGAHYDDGKDIDDDHACTCQTCGIIPPFKKMHRPDAKTRISKGKKKKVEKG